ARRSDRPSVAEPLLDIYMKMLDNEVTDDIARHLVERLNNEISAAEMNKPDKVQEAVLAAIAMLMPVNGEIQLREDGKPTVVVVVGPTGVGKTTSVAKLATQFRVHHKRRVGLITEDTSRPGGMEQLRSVAQLLNIPLSVADTPERIRAAINQAQDREIVFVDTAGRVPKDTVSLKELAKMLEIVHPDEVHLALCGFSSHKHILDLLKRFGLVKFNRVLLTKLDEAITYGILMTIAAHMDCGLSYITTGQDYMENIETGNARMLARLVLGEISLPRSVPVT
ncbi:MAG: AAA family ATPase, partial [Planctomycetes bacterium]|nr:AAA family ATPase [Planctomycetota bacterium]